MDELELLTRQRQALRAFRQTVAATIRQEQEATRRVEAVAVKARDDGQAHTRQAQSWLQEAREALSTGREALKRVNLADLLEQKAVVPSLEPGTNARAELERSAATAGRAATGAEQVVYALQQWRKMRAQRPKRVLIVLVIVAIGLACFGVLLWVIWTLASLWHINAT